VKSLINEDFLKTYRRLPKNVRERTRRAYRLFKSDPHRRSLNFKLVNAEKRMWSARISDNYRTLGTFESDTITWFWVGSHAEYDKIVNRP
jgi:mRNA-degrading endonuclease RelE of RelBE toxin-antitoxin system